MQAPRTREAQWLTTAPCNASSHRSVSRARWRHCACTSGDVASWHSRCAQNADTHLLPFRRAQLTGSLAPAHTHFSPSHPLTFHPLHPCVRVCVSVWADPGRTSLLPRCCRGWRWSCRRWRGGPSPVLLWGWRGGTERLGLWLAPYPGGTVSALPGTCSYPPTLPPITPYLSLPSRPCTYSRLHPRPVRCCSAAPP